MTDHQCAVCGGTDISIRHDGSRPHDWVTPDLCTRCADGADPGEVAAYVFQRLADIAFRLAEMASVFSERGDARRAAMIQSVHDQLLKAIADAKYREAFIAFRASQENNGEGASA